MIRSYFLLVLFLLGSLSGKAQENYTLNIQSSAFKNLSYQKTFQDSTARTQELLKVQTFLFEEGYFLADLDSTTQEGKNLTVYLQEGNAYQWAALKKGNVREDILTAVGFREKIYRGEPLHYKKLAKLRERLLDYCENNGYPFARFKLDSVTIEENQFSASLSLDLNRLVKIDSVVIKGEKIVNPVYLYNYLGIEPGNLYNESLIEQVDKRIKEIPFAQSIKPHEVVFTEEESKLLLYLKKRKASQFDGIIGLLPNDQNELLITGDVKLKLQNALKQGELIDINWRRLQANTQDLKTHLNYPFVLSSPFGLDYSLKLYKRDTFFIDIRQHFGVQYLMRRGNYLQVFLDRQESNLLSTSGLEFQTVLPDYADISATLYGIGFKSEKLDYRLNPRKGYRIEADVAAGNKNIRKNNNLNPVVYENLELKSVQYRGNLSLDYFIPFGQRSTVKLSNLTSVLFGNSIFENEWFRFGGLKTLRGFDEESIWASQFSVMSVEYRFLLEENSYLFGFIDGAYYESISVNKYLNDTPYGFGAGISFETKAGIFSITYALGKQFDNPIQFSSGKVHFGIVNYF